MSDRYEFARSGREKSVQLIFPEGGYEGLPFEVRLAAPWVGGGYGELGDLKPAERWHFHQRGYVIRREAAIMIAHEQADAETRPADDARVGGMQEAA